MPIQQLRLQRGWSQQQLAQLSGLSARTIQRLENGQAASPESLKALAAVFEVDWQTLQAPTPAPVEAAPDAAEATTRKLARRRSRFYRHLLLYAAVMLGLLLINALTHRGHWWVIWPALGWGLALLLRALKLCRVNPFGPG